MEFSIISYSVTTLYFEILIELRISLINISPVWTNVCYFHLLAFGLLLVFLSFIVWLNYSLEPRGIFVYSWIHFCICYCFSRFTIFTLFWFFSLFFSRQTSHWPHYNCFSFFLIYYEESVEIFVFLTLQLNPFYFNQKWVKVKLFEKRIPMWSLFMVGISISSWWNYLQTGKYSCVS